MSKIINSKISGIYQIINNINGKVYIGHSVNISFRWYNHMNNLLKGNHHNSKLQDDFNTYGLSAFNFNILDTLEGKSNLILKEQEYLDKLDFTNNYNLSNALEKEKHSQPDIFIEYINNKWLLPDNLNSNDKDIEKYKIFKKEDKEEIFNKAIECQLIDLPKSHMTFNRVINFMTDKLGYTINNKRKRIKRKQYRYKLIVDFDEDYMENFKD